MICGKRLFILLIRIEFLIMVPVLFINLHSFHCGWYYNLESGILLKDQQKLWCFYLQALLLQLFHFLVEGLKKTYINEVKYKSIKQARIRFLFKYVTRKVIGHVNVCVRDIGFAFIWIIFRLNFGSVLMLWYLFFVLFVIITRPMYP